jgi:hypothetical protein
MVNAILRIFVKTCEFENFYLYIQVTRGIPENFDDNILREHAATKKYKHALTMFYSKITNLVENNIIW